jgi:hypothetical protein
VYARNEMPEEGGDGVGSGSKNGLGIIKKKKYIFS